jgi:proliferating cell nuclear antigen PCNA
MSKAKKPKLDVELPQANPHPKRKNQGTPDLVATLKADDIFKAMFGVMSDLAKNGVANIYFTEGSMFSQMLDGAHGAMVDICLEKGAFEDFSCRKSFTVGVSLTNLLTGLSIGRDMQTVITGKDGSDVISLTHSGRKGGGNIDIRMPLIDINAEYQKMGDAETVVRIRISSRQFSEIIKDMDQAGGETVDLLFERDGIYLSTDGECLSAKASLAIGEEAAYGLCTLEYLSEKPSVHLSINIVYLKTLVKGASLCSFFDIEVMDTLLMRVSYDMGEDHAFNFYVCPRIEEP